jgi:two-component system response regulator PhoP
LRILIVEDEAILREQLADNLREAGYAVETAADGEDGLYWASELELDAAIIDLGLPKMGGIELIETLRKRGKAFPVLILTARDHWQDKVKGLAAGADDYVVKPFHAEEIRARLNALLRRAKGFSQPKVMSGPVVLDTHDQLVTCSGKVLDLTAFEYKVLEYLLLNPGKVISKSELTEHLYEQDFERDSNVIEVFVGRLRKKIDPDGVLQPIETLRGRGYRWRLDVEKG